MSASEGKGAAGGSSGGFFVVEDREPVQEFNINNKRIKTKMGLSLVFIFTLKVGMGKTLLAHTAVELSGCANLSGYINHKDTKKI